MIEFEAVVMSPVGLHARPAALFVKKVAGSGLKVTVEPIVDGVPTGKADGKSILSVLALGIKSGQTVRVTVEGDDPDVLVAELKEILADPEG
jgi:phosphotransferase system HPr (HPr) family protein